VANAATSLQDKYRLLARQNFLCLGHALSFVFDYLSPSLMSMTVFFKRQILLSDSPDCLAAFSINSFSRLG
jgi:hypothetical protein